MKYGESIFDILYLLFVIISGFVMLRKAKGPVGRLMGAAALILGFGDAFHLVPRVLNYFLPYDFTAFLGIGKLITSITMTVFYVLLYHIWRKHFKIGKGNGLRSFIWCLAAVRIALCLFPQNRWMHNGSSIRWAVIRNVPFVILGAVICWLFFRKRKEDRTLRSLWIYIFLSFLFYIPVAVAAGSKPVLGMLMLPKTVCYILMVAAFLKVNRKKKKKKKA